MKQSSKVKAPGGSPPENYERYFVPAIGAPAASELMKVAALRPGERVLDVACGTGVVARLAAEAVGDDGKVTGLDINGGMLAVARATTPPGKVIAWHEASAEAMPFPEESFDAVLCQMGLQFMPDKHAALSEMRRVLTPGGGLVLSVPGPTPELFVMMEEALEHYIGAEAKRFVAQVFSLHDTAEIHDLISGAGFREVTVQADTQSLTLPPPEEFLWQYIYGPPLAGPVAQMSDDRRASLQRDVGAKGKAFVQDRALRLAVRIVVATARK